MVSLSRVAALFYEFSLCSLFVWVYISIYICVLKNPYLNQQKPLFLPIIAYTLSSTKLEIRAK
jgi:hypothetical protein